MKIYCKDFDDRLYTDPSYFSNMGSFSMVTHGFAGGLKEIGCHTENPDAADFHFFCDSWRLNYQYNDKRTVISNVCDVINCLPNHLLTLASNYKPRIVGLSNQITNLWIKHGFSDVKTVMPGVDPNFWHQTQPKDETVTFLFESHFNIRAGMDLALKAYDLAFRGDRNAKLVIKMTDKNSKLEETIRSYADKGNNIQVIIGRIDKLQMRDLFSSASVYLGLMRFSSWGLGIQQATLCNTLPILGDFCPSNEMNCGFLLKPSEEIEINSIKNELVNFGLADCYGNFDYAESPRFYDYDIESYASIMKDVYFLVRNNPTKLNNFMNGWKKDIISKFSWKDSAKNLVNVLSQI